MPFNTLPGALNLVRSLGPATLLQSLIQPWRRAYRVARVRSRGKSLGAFLRAWGAAWRMRAPDWDAIPWTFVGGLVAYSREGRYLTLRCENATIRLAVLAPDLVQVRLSTSGSLAPAFSYAVCKPEEAWPEVEYEVEEGAEALWLRTGRLQVRIDRQPCRLTFLDPSGQEVQADEEGMGWSGEAVVADKALAADEHIYGLGEKAFGLDLRGNRFEMWNSDPRSYSAGTDPIYLNIPFLLGLRGTAGYGLFFDNSFRAHFDLGASTARRLRFAAAGGEMRYYFFYGPALSTVLERYTELTGRMPLPPLWALGYHQSRWSYYPEAQVREVARQLRAQRIPCDAIHLDIDYMRGFRCFTWDEQRFPNPPRLVADLQAAGLKTVVILDPGIKDDPEYDVCREGLEQGLFARYPDGTPFKGPVWPGNAYLPDFTAERVRRWWAGHCRELWARDGVAGIWNDMNEPTIFGALPGEAPPDDVLHDMEERGGTHAEAHNVYGMQMVRATREGHEATGSAERPLVITRAGFAGVQRYSAHWTGDNESTWEHLRLTIPMLLELGLSGLAFTGCDTGGFDGAASGELVVRWTQLSSLTPYCRNHTALGTPPQEPWAFSEPYQSLIRSAIELRYQLLPCLYTACWQCATRGLPIIRPLFLEFQEDTTTHPLDDQYLLGDSLLVAPIGRPGATSRPVYLPAGPWYHWASGRRYEGPATITVDAPLPELPLFARGGRAVPIWPLMQYVGERPVGTLTLRIYPGNGTSWLYEDDGRSTDYQRGVYRLSRFTLEEGEEGLSIERGSEGTYQPDYHHYRLVIWGQESPPAAVTVDGAPAQAEHNPEAQTVELYVETFRRVEIKR